MSSDPAAVDDDEWSTAEIQLAPEYRDEPVERFIFAISTPETFDEEARDRLRSAFRKTCARCDVPMAIYEAREQSVLVGFPNVTNSPLVRVYRTIQSRVQTEYKSLIERAERQSKVPLDLEPLAFGGMAYLGPGTEDYREAPPTIPRDDDLDHTPFPELKRLSMAHGLQYINHTKKHTLVEQLKEARSADPSRGLTDRVKAAFVGEELT